ncbi:hypothetical protein ACFWWC_15680 [Streptomyces sp. NPDC058642]|uniref:hypothetical protein n=1 Tax=Streptomyces sp. NPDC058642 TaxID=3346572 RepID=UPI00366073DF
MAHSFLLKLTSSGASPHIYRALVDGTRETFLTFDEAGASIELTDSQGNFTGIMRMNLSDGNVRVTSSESTPELQSEADDFSLMAAHLAAQWKRLGHAPTEVRKFFA